MADSKLLCEFVKDSGDGCKAAPVKGSRFCYFHSPDLAEKRADNRRRGGENSRRYVLLPDVEPPTNAHEVKELMSRVLAGVLQGNVDPKIANAAAILGRELTKAIQLSQRMGNERFGVSLDEFEGIDDYK